MSTTKLDLAGHFAKYGEAINNARCFHHHRVVTDRHGVAMRVGEEAHLGVARIVDHIRAMADNDKILLGGNGGSLSACQHIATDFMLAGHPAWALSDGVNLTCAANDYTYSQSLLRQLVWMKATRGDMVFLLSTSGNSENILSAARWCRDQKIPLVTLSGCSDKNELLQLGNMNFHVSSEHKGRIQIAHEAILHGIVDLLAGMV